MGKSLCMSCGHIGHLTYLHNDYHCEECYSRNTVAWNNEIKEPRQVLVESKLGLLGALEGKKISNGKKYFTYFGS